MPWGFDCCRDWVRRCSPGGAAYVRGAFAEGATFGAGEPSETSLTSVGATHPFLARFAE
jgi:hypothetical protein